MPDRRTLTFARLEEIMPEVDRLLAGHATVGNWSLGQICNHLSGAIRTSVEGPPVRAPWIIRAAIGPLVKRQILTSGTIKEGIKTLEQFVPKPDLDARAEAEALRATISYYLTHPETRAMHPFFGAMKPEEWDRMHCIHAAHHLRFAVPG
jgi:hypothetical protein